jgi:hypothetical protein
MIDLEVSLFVFCHLFGVLLCIVYCLLVSIAVCFCCVFV